MIDKILKDILATMSCKLNEEQLVDLESTMYLAFRGVEVKPETYEIAIQSRTNEALIRQFVASKKLEGRQDNTLAGYVDEIERVLRFIGKNIIDITKMDMKVYFASLKEIRHVKARTLNTRERYMNSFFTFLVNEDFIDKNPMAGISAMKEEKLIKKPFSDEDLERLRNTCTCSRDRAMVEFLYATGVRVSELTSIKISDVNFYDKKLIVYGKESKERYVLFSDKARYYLRIYMSERKDDCEFLFTGTIGTKRQLNKVSIQALLRKLGKRAGVDNVHPHRFRRTCATNLLLKGMPLEQVKEFLGHEKMDTTLMYSQVSHAQVESSYRRIMAA